MENKTITLPPSFSELDGLINARSQCLNETPDNQINALEANQEHLRKALRSLYGICRDLYVENQQLKDKLSRE